jgi:hypothetical protein
MAKWGKHSVEKQVRALTLPARIAAAYQRSAERRLPIGAQDAILPHISKFDFSQLLSLPAPIQSFFIIMGGRRSMSTPLKNKLR